MSYDVMSSKYNVLDPINDKLF